MFEEKLKESIVYLMQQIKRKEGNYFSLRYPKTNNAVALPTIVGSLVT